MRACCCKRQRALRGRRVLHEVFEMRDRAIRQMILRVGIREPAAQIEIARIRRHGQLPRLGRLGQIAQREPLRAELHEHLRRLRIAFRQQGHGLLVPGRRFPRLARFRGHPRQGEERLRAQFIDLRRALVSGLRLVELARFAQQMPEDHLAREVVIRPVFLDELARFPLVEIQLPQPIQRRAFGGIRRQHLLVALDDLFLRRLRVERRGEDRERWRACGGWACGCRKIDAPAQGAPGVSSPRRF